MLGVLVLNISITNAFHLSFPSYIRLYYVGKLTINDEKLAVNGGKE